MHMYMLHEINRSLKFQICTLQALDDVGVTKCHKCNQKE